MAQFTGVAGKAVALTESNTAFGRTFGILVGTAGNAPLTMADGTDITLPVQAGFNPLSITKWRSGGTAAGLYALYEVP